jgi:hypothetical protein
MRRVLGALAALLTVLAITLVMSSPAGAAPMANPSAKHRCKHKSKHHRKHRKRCRKKRGVPGPTDSKAGNPEGSSGPPGRLLVTERELSATQLQLQLSRANLPAGASIVEQYNAGEDPHNLILERQGAVAFSYPTLDPGLTQRQTVTLAHGTWTLYCSLLDHKALGMQATLTVN